MSPVDRALVLATSLLSFAFACDAAPDASRLVVRDSAGISIVENDAPAWTDATRWRLSDEPVRQIGEGTTGDPELQFAYIEGVHRLAGGGLAVIDAWAPAVLFFDSAGNRIGRIGRTGSGPGEFPTRASPRSFTCGTDTVYVVIGRDIAAYVPPGEYAQTTRFDVPAYIQACGSRGWIAQQSPLRRREEPGIYRDSIVLGWYDSAGTLRVVIDTLPSEERSWSISAEGPGYSRLAFGRTLSIAAGEPGLATGFGDAFEIEVRDESGAVTRLIRVPSLTEPVSDTDIARFRGYVMNPFRGNDRELVRLEEQLEAARERTRPAFAELRFDDEGNLWVRRYDQLDAVEFYDYSRVSRTIDRPLLEESRRWHVFDPDGRYLGEIAMPPDFVVHGIGRDRALGVWRDELDIPYVREYALIKPGG